MEGCGKCMFKGGGEVKADWKGRWENEGEKEEKS